jgi:signal transduction histidine kinase
MQDRSSSSPSPAAPAGSAGRAPAAADERALLLSQFIAAGEQERRRLAEGIHDDSIQAMAALGMRLQMLRRTLSESEQVACLTEAEQAVQLTIARLRHLVFELHPPGLEQEGLSVALAIAIDAQRTPAVDCRFNDHLRAQPTTEASAVLFRIAQEALENAHEHAGASSISVTLLEREGGHAVLVADDGCGFDPALAAPGSPCAGFAAMRARAELGSGMLRVESARGVGTTVEAWLPRARGFLSADRIEGSDENGLA